MNKGCTGGSDRNQGQRTGAEDRAGDCGMLTSESFQINNK
jgi:hypothetical protein